MAWGLTTWDQRGVGADCSEYRVGIVYTTWKLE